MTTQEVPASGALPTRGRAEPAPDDAEAEIPHASREGQHVVILSGLSGGGKTAAAKLFEDLGYTVVDNLPGELLIELAELVSDEPERFDKVAIVLDVRSGDAPMAFGAMRGALEGRGIRPQVFFLEARDEVLIRRFSETRHRHPLSDQRGIASSIAAERRLLDPVRSEADVVIDTSDLSLRELRERIFTRLGEAADPSRLAIQLISFGFKYGVPLEADLVFDVRFMQNPYYIDELRQLSGMTEAVREFVLGQPVAQEFLRYLHEFLKFSIPAYVGEGKTRLTIALGCTGGYHRSIALAEELANWLREQDFGPVAVFHRERDPAMNLRRWLTPGIGVKRWLLLTFVGCLVLALGVAHVVRQATQDVNPGGLIGAALYTITLQFLPYWGRGLLAGLLGIALVGFGAYRTIRALTSPFMPSAGTGGRLVELIFQRRSLARGPRVVVIGGGTGLSTLLRGLKEHTSNLTAIVAVADDGGSTGVLRDTMAIPPVGDIRRCLAALADDETLVGEVLEHRFAGSPTDPAPAGGGPFGGHPVGNILLAAMTQLQGGDFEEAVRLANRVLAIRGQVLPAAATPLTLHARLHDGTVVDGQSIITRSRGIDRAWVTPSDVPASDDALAAIADAEVIVLGPGSIYTSLLPSLLLPQVSEAIATSSALRIFVCNVATQLGETMGMDLADHVAALTAHAGPDIVDVVLANNRLLGTSLRPPAESVRLTWPPDVTPLPKLVLDDVVDPTAAQRHDPRRLAAAIVRIHEREGSARRRAAVGRTA